MIKLQCLFRYGMILLMVFVFTVSPAHAAFEIVEEEVIEECRIAHAITNEAQFVPQIRSDATQANRRNTCSVEECLIDAFGVKRIYLLHCELTLYE